MVLTGRSATKKISWTGEWVAGTRPGTTLAVQSGGVHSSMVLGVLIHSRSLGDYARNTSDTKDVCSGDCKTDSCVVLTSIKAYFLMMQDAFKEGATCTRGVQVEILPEAELTAEC